MLSRIADSLFWTSRYMERADSMLRMLRINYITSLDLAGHPDFSWEPALRVFSTQPVQQLGHLVEDSDATLRHLLFQRDNDNSLRNVVTRARENARGCQDHLTKEVWESINEFHLWLNGGEAERTIANGEQIVALGALLQRCLLYSGVAEQNMPRGQGWNYMNLGKFIERGILTINILLSRFGRVGFDVNSTADVLYWRNLLLTLGGYEQYLKEFRGIPESRGVAQLVILHPEFPRSLAYCVFRIERTVQHLMEESPDTADVLRRTVGRLRAKVEFADLDSITEMGLESFLTDVRQDFYTLHSALAKGHFAYA